MRRRRWRREESFEVSRWLFLRALGVIHLGAFLSLRPQVLGLVGERGILPVQEYLQRVRGLFPGWKQRLQVAPTLFWIDASDETLTWACRAGIMASCLLSLGLLPLPALMVLWALYLSFVVVGREFLRFQWDALLLETTALSTLIAPPTLRLRLGAHRPAARGALWLLRFLAFRLMFSSGAVKLRSGDRSWRRLTALEHHYETQPLPPWTAWFAHQAPRSLHKTATATTFIQELVAPLGMLGPRPFRRAAGVSTVGLQALISATGNYGFFNALTAALTLPLLDDACFPRALAARAKPRKPRRHSLLAGGARVAANAFFLLSGVVPLALTVSERASTRRSMGRVLDLLAPLHLANPYGLFAVMTTRRPEVILEGSGDGETWRPYELKWKPGDVHQRPRFVTPLHMPRLDWLMWFAALDPIRGYRWVTNLMTRLLEGSPPVLRLFGHNPFPGRPPRLMRASLYDYRFTNRYQRRHEGAWWEREELGPYLPYVLTRRDAGRDRPLV
ncbi:MAG: lipase maturation factor family protein [Myxococcota bacterium]